MTFIPEVAVYRRSDGVLEYVTDRANAPSPGHATLASAPLPTKYDDQTFGWSVASRSFVEDPAKVQASLLASIKSEAEQRKMALLTPGGAKKTEYADKAAEVRTWNTLGGTLTGAVAVLGLIGSAKMKATFPYALADAAAFGDTIDKAIARFTAGMTGSSSVPAIAAAEAKACAAIKAAASASAKRTAAAAITWA